MGTKYFSEEAVKEIIKKTMEKSKEKESLSAKEEGISLDELLEIGKEVGLNIDHLKTVALEYDNQKVTRHTGLTDTHIFEEREFESAVPEDIVWDDVTAELTHHFGGAKFGTVNQDPRKKEWVHVSVSGIETIVSLVKRNKHTKLRLSQRVGLGSPLTEGIMYGGALAAVLYLILHAAFNPSIITGITLGSGLWAISSVLVYFLDVSWRKKKLKGLKTLMDKIINQLPKSIEEVKSKTQVSNEDTSSIEIESPEVYDKTESEEKQTGPIKNQLRE